MLFNKASNAIALARLPLSGSVSRADVTYDIYGLSGKQIVGLLPPEFDVWHSQKTIDEPRA